MKFQTTHGKSNTPEYRSWAHMKERCFNPKHHAYDQYGGRGITVCARWLQFENFLADMGERPKGMTLDRFPNNDGNYEVSNCRWATPSQQQINKRPYPRASRKDPAYFKACSDCGVEKYYSPAILLRLANPYKCRLCRYGRNWENDKLRVA